MKNPTDKELMVKIDEYMARNNLNQEEVAKQLNVSPTTISKWRAGVFKIGNINRRGIILLTTQEEEIRKTNKEKTCVITGMDKCPLQDYSHYTKGLIEEIIDLNKEQTKQVISFIEEIKRGKPIEEMPNAG